MKFAAGSGSEVALGRRVTPARQRPARPRRRRIAPGSLEDRILEVIPPAPVDMDAILAAGKARPEDVKAALLQLRREGVVAMVGNKRGARYVRVS